MYTTCLFCNGDLGRNEVVEAFPVGRRLAFDATKGRLWVVCRRCERWNLTPLEERWEAIEQCERDFRATKLRVSTDQIGLARLKEGLELVRIGAPQRPEMAAWRYGDQFGRRRRRHYLMIAGGAAAVGALIVAGPVLGLISGAAVQPVMNLFNMGHGMYRSRKLIHVPGPGGVTLHTRLADLQRITLSPGDEGFVLRLPLATRERLAPWWRYDTQREARELTGDDAIRAAGALLPRMNQRGGSANDVQRAVEYLERAQSPAQLYRRAAQMIPAREHGPFRSRGKSLLKNLPTAGRLALEMAAHEETERRALEGELSILEEAWRNAEEIAGIADDMFLPASVEDDLARLKKERGSNPP
jgi:hypothetical protein